MTGPSREDIEVLIRQAGLSLSPAQLDDIQEGWAWVQPMLARVRGDSRANPCGSPTAPVLGLCAEVHEPAVPETKSP